MEKLFFKSKYCKVVLDNGFVIYGVVDDVDDTGFFFTTKDFTSYMTWTSIRSIVEHRGGY